MKLKVSHLFFLLLGVLLLSNLGLSLKEGFGHNDSAKFSKNDESPDSDDDNTLSNLNQIDLDDKYILKSKIVPPVCPKCPDVKLCPKCNGEAVQPCPPCGRCPKPAFKCAKVPDYSSSSVDNSLPRPMLSDFSQFSSPSAM